MSELLRRAFGALGVGASWRELQLVGDAVRESRDEDALAAREDAPRRWGEGEDRQAMAELAKLAKASGSSGFEALNLVVEVLESRRIPSSA